MSYTSPHHHTEKELLDAEIADFEVDHSCAIRDGLDDYAVEIALKLITAKARRERLEILCDREIEGR